MQNIYHEMWFPGYSGFHKTDAPPHKRPSCMVNRPASFGLISYYFSYYFDRWDTCISFGRSFATWFAIIPGSAHLIPVYAGLNSRLGRLRELACKKLIFLVILRSDRWRKRENRKNSLFHG